jgi:hypothetical protein
MAKRKFTYTALIIVIDLILIFAVLAGAEWATRKYFYSEAEQKSGAAALWDSLRNEWHPTIVEQGSGKCSYYRRVIPHPYLGYVYDPNSRCMSVNKLGFNTAEYPLKRNPDYFTILVLGGSVAEQISLSNSNASWLAAELNLNYRSPTGKPFLVLEGALGGWILPQALTMLNSYGGVVDAVITLAGHNEAASIGFPNKPDLETYITSMRRADDILNLALIRVLSYMRVESRTDSTLRDSFLAYTIFRKLLGLIPATEASSSYRMALKRMYAFPEQWNRKDHVEWARDSYKTNLKLLKASADVYKIPYMNFVQPIRVIGKELTAEEKSYENYVPADVYKTIILAPHEELRAEGFPTVSLTQVFKNEKQTIYADHVHCKYTDEWDNPGYRIMAHAMAEAMAKKWHFQKR